METMHFDLVEAINELQELCPLVTPGRNVPTEIVTGIRQTYKQIQDQLTKIRGVKQLLEGKYRQYYQQHSQRDREISEFTFLAKNLYSKFEYTLQEIEAKKNSKELRPFVAPREPIPVQWFRSRGNQITLLRNLRDLSVLDYNIRLGSEYEQRREIVRSGMRSVTLFVMSGEVTLINKLESRMQLREYDIKERSAQYECRGALTHLKEISPLDVERIIRRLTAGGFSKVKCLLLRVQTQEDLETEIIGTIEDILRVTAPGEIRTLSI
jgi:hypothetical protein